MDNIVLEKSGAFDAWAACVNGFRSHEITFPIPPVPLRWRKDCYNHIRGEKPPPTNDGAISSWAKLQRARYSDNLMKALWINHTSKPPPIETGEISKWVQRKLANHPDELMKILWRHSDVGKVCRESYDNENNFGQVVTWDKKSRL